MREFTELENQIACIIIRHILTLLFFIGAVACTYIATRSISAAAAMAFLIWASNMGFQNSKR